jgi:YVTN family beta-propeller protein
MLAMTRVLGDALGGSVRSTGIGRVGVVAALGIALGALAGCGSASSGSSASATAGVSGLTAYITNSQDNGKTTGMGTVIPVNLSAGEPATPIELGEGAGTNDIIVTADGTTAWVSNEDTNSVASIDLATGQTGEPITVGSEPVDIKFVPGTDEEWAWVANYGDKTITTVNLATGEVGQTIAVPEAGPNTVAFTPDGRTCYVANWGTDDAAGSTVTPIEVTDGGASGRVLPSISVGLNPNWVAITPDGRTAYVANKGSSSITPIEVATNTAGAEIALPGPPIQMEIAPDGTLAYIAVAGSSPEIDAVVPMDLTVTPGTVGPAIALASKAQPHWIAFTPDGQTAYVVGNGNSTLTPIAVASGSPGTPIQVSTDPDADLLAIAIVPAR